MENGGTLRKRARRPIARVKDRQVDSSQFDSLEELKNAASSSVVIRTTSDTRINITKVERKNEKKLPSITPSSTVLALKVIINLGLICGVFPWKFDAKSRKIVRWKNPIFIQAWKIVWLLGLCQTFGLSLYHFRTWLEMWHIEGIPYKAMFSYFLCVHWHAMSTIKRIVIIAYGEKIREYINQLEDFNQTFSSAYLVATDNDILTGWGKRVINFGIPAGISQIINSVSFFILMPFQPWYLTSRIWPKPWYWLIPGIIQDVNLVGHVITVYTLTCWILVVHANTAQFWLRESHKDNESGYTSPDLRDEDSCKPLELYRALQVLCINYNSTMAPLALPALKIEIANGLIPCWFVLLRTSEADFSKEWSSVLTNAFGVITLSVVGFGCLSVGGQMSDISSGFIHSWAFMRSKEFRATLHSFPSLNMKIAGFYCVSGATAVTFFRIIFDWVVNCVITFR